MASPEPSARSPRAPASLTVSIPRRITCRLAAMTSCRSSPSRLLHRPVLPERPAHHFGRDPLAPALDLELGTCLRRLRGQERGADGRTQGRALGAASHLVHLLALVPHRIALSRDAA